ncbi:FRG domain-containing protein [Pectobacterium carotovorum]|uniref:FRG domain-containing protein n=1 Tax=Pectobacterium carotovorum TaxID=554 RepID=UPI00191EDB5A|nr:FRG domain-containing protein [Pectobacterium carotovorum]MBL0866741.1 FRG domain-containing protein [Pectobacterium carotovorum]
MKKHTVASIQELKTILGEFGSGALFRGQVDQYGSDDLPKMNTSFSRKGCIPSLMQRWIHYASFALAALLGRDHQEVSFEFTQAVLQHYGWRTFFLDASSNPAVSAWFASHICSEDRSVELCEDCFEDPVFLVKKRAKYDYRDGIGYLYVLSKDELNRSEIGLIDLASIEFPDHRPRFHVQQAWLLGPIHKDLPVDCVHARIEAPRSVFRAYANEQGLITTENLFPDIRHDPVLEILSSMPWKHRLLPNEKSDDLKFFCQPLELPEYHESFRKRNPPHVAFYEGAVSGAEMRSDVAVFETPEIVVYGFAPIVTMKFPNVLKLLQDEKTHIVFEIDSLVRRPGRLNADYLKGVAVSKVERGLFAVADFIVNHPGRQLHGCGINQGWHYRIDNDGKWIRQISSEDCSCGNNSIHYHHLSMLTIIDSLLSENPSPITDRKVNKKIG